MRAIAWISGDGEHALFPSGWVHMGAVMPNAEAAAMARSVCAVPRMAPSNVRLTAEAPALSERAVWFDEHAYDAELIAHAEREHGRLWWAVSSIRYRLNRVDGTGRRTASALIGHKGWRVVAIIAPLDV